MEDKMPVTAAGLVELTRHAVRIGNCGNLVPIIEQWVTQASKEIVRLRMEVERLKRGDFTPEEFQALCHHRDEKPGCTRTDFEEGCREYQRKLFGPAETCRWDVPIDALTCPKHKGSIRDCPLPSGIARCEVAGVDGEGNG